MATQTAAATGPRGVYQPDSDVHITYEDQQRINTFAKFIAKIKVRDKSYPSHKVWSVIFNNFLTGSQRRPEGETERVEDPGGGLRRDRAL